MQHNEESIVMYKIDTSSMQHDDPSICMYKIGSSGMQHYVKQFSVCTILITVVCSMTN